MAEALEDEDILLRTETAELLSEFGSDQLTLQCADPGDQNILKHVFYIAGFIARSISKTSKCQFCKELYIASDKAPILVFTDDSEDTESIPAEDVNIFKKAFMEQVNRGSLCAPTDLVFHSCFYIWNCYLTLGAHKKLLNKI